MIDFTGQVVLVTGVGGGLGRQCALEFARRGAAVVTHDMGGALQGDGQDGHAAAEVAAEIEREGGIAVPSHHSVDSAAGGQAIVGTAVDWFGRLDAVVCNAAFPNRDECTGLSPDRWQRMLRVHLVGGCFLGRAAFGVMEAQSYGRFVFIASPGELFGQPVDAHYAAAKAGLVGLANMIAIEGAEPGILANTLLPIGYSSGSYEQLGDPERISVQLRGWPPSARSASPPSAAGPELVVPTVVYLSSSACAVSQHIFTAGDGRCARVSVGLSNGWQAKPGINATADEIAAHVSAISATQPCTIPTSIVDQITEFGERSRVARDPAVQVTREG